MRRGPTVLAWAVTLALLAAGRVVAGDDQLPEVTHDGLRRVPDARVAGAWIKPDADFGVYQRVMILEPYVAFRKGWAADLNRSSLQRITKHDVEKLRQAMADLFLEVFTEELDTEGGYGVVETPDTNVLLLRPAILDLDITAPDLGRAERSYAFASSAGAATLLLELYDSVSGEILARAIDRQAAPGHVMQYSNKVTNRAEARRILAGWARLLRQGLAELRSDDPEQGGKQ